MTIDDKLKKEIKDYQSRCDTRDNMKTMAGALCVAKEPGIQLYLEMGAEKIKEQDNWEYVQKYSFRIWDPFQRLHDFGGSDRFLGDRNIKDALLDRIEKLGFPEEIPYGQEVTWRDYQYTHDDRTYFTKTLAPVIGVVKTVTQRKWFRKHTKQVYMTRQEILDALRA